jgi:hypothetical protein
MFEGFVNRVELFLRQDPARDLGLVSANGNIEPRLIQSGDRLRHAGQQLEVGRRLDVG